ncbi:uncharacterized protein LOC144121791 [Amblyomma americanum]
MTSKLALATLLTGFLWAQGISEELPCDVKASYTCFWDISTKFRKVVEDTGNVLSAACSIAKELPTENKCESLYMGCMDEEKNQFLTMESGYASLLNITANNRTCTSGGYQRGCDDSSGMKNCTETGIEAAFSTFEEQVYSKQRSAARFRNCFLDTVADCYSIQNVGRALRMLRVVNAIVDINSPLNFTLNSDSSSKNTVDTLAISIISFMWLTLSFT